MFINTENMKLDNNYKMYFLNLNDVEEILYKELREQFDRVLFHELINKFLIVTIPFQGEVFLWKDELDICRRLLNLNILQKKIGIKDCYINGTFLVKKVRISEDTTIYYEMNDSKKTIPAFVRNILYITLKQNCEQCEKTQLELMGIDIVTTNIVVRNYIENAIYRKHKLDHIKGSSFANSSSYMGSKKKLVGFLVESMFPHCKENSIFLDLMCGSGAVSNALAQMGEVYASDAQQFCTLLAKIQGAGFEEKDAEKLINQMYKDYSYNLQLLKNIFSKELMTEEEIFHMDLADKEKVFDCYEKFVDSYQLYSSTYVCSERVNKEIEQRKRNNFIKPYCLFTYYFANVYFGVEQSIQLDSIRYAIDQIEDKEEREWALGVLVIVTSLIATTYGGHFAQPRRLDLKSFDKMIIQRSKSAWLEFSKRMLTIADESSRYSNKVTNISGPWEEALKYFNEAERKKLVVYLDAPYKREEYSRYYHVLETIVKYDYPESENKGRMRSKIKGERFNTEFFSKTAEKVESVFEKIITEILYKNSICVWSYSDNGAVSLMNVVNRVKKKMQCEVYFYSIPYKHSVQGKSTKSRMAVIEYSIVFVKEHETSSNVI